MVQRGRMAPYAGLGHWQYIVSTVDCGQSTVGKRMPVLAQSGLMDRRHRVRHSAASLGFAVV